MFRAMFGFEGTNLHKKKVILDSSMVEHSAVNRVVVGSSPTRGARKHLMSVSDKTVERMGEKPEHEAPWSSGQDIALSRR